MLIRKIYLCCSQVLQTTEDVSLILEREQNREKVAPKTYEGSFMASNRCSTNIMNYFMNQISMSGYNELGFLMAELAQH